jgi:hypothetical protein
MPDNNQIQVHLPDGSIKQLPAGSTAHDVAMSISPRLAAAAIVAQPSGWSICVRRLPKMSTYNC